MISIENIGVRFAGKYDNFSVSIPKLVLNDNEATFLFGPSGSGKTTVLNAIVGNLGSRVTLRPSSVPIGYVMHEPSLLPWRTIEANATLEEGLRRQAFSYSEFSELLERFGLERSVLRKKPWELSFGMRQRVEIAKCIAFKTKLLLFDEAISGVDERNKENVIVALDNYLAEMSGTLLFVTHDIGDLARLADRVIKIRDGKVVDDFGAATPRHSRSTVAPSKAMEAWDLTRLLAP